MEAYIEAAKRMHGQHEDELRNERSALAARAESLRAELSEAARGAAAGAKAQQELSVMGTMLPSPLRNPSSS